MDPSAKARLGDVEFFKQVGLDIIQNFRSDEFRTTLLQICAGHGKLNCCKVIFERCPELLYTANKTGATPLHVAALWGHAAIVEYLLSAGVEKKVSQEAVGIVQDIETGVIQGKVVNYKLLMMVGNGGHTALHLAVRKGYRRCVEVLLNADNSNTLLRMAGNIGQTALHLAVRKGCPRCVEVLLNADNSNTLLRMVDNKQDAAMHIAVRDLRLEIVKLLLEADSAFVYAPDKSGQTVHLIALQESFSGDKAAVAIRKLLIEKQPHECETRIGDREWTLLHHATSRGDITAIEDILEFSPDCAKLVDNKGQNFLHLAAMLEHEKVVRYIIRSTTVDAYILNQPDMNGDTPFHIATSKGNVNVILPMLYDLRFDKFALDKQGKTALAAINFEYDKRRAGVYGYIDRVDEKDLKDRSEFDLLVGALISTVSFTAGITVPGGYLNEGPNQGNAILYKKASFEVFVVSNTIALALSLYAVFCHFCTKHLTETKDIIYQLQVATFCSLGSIFAMMAAFITGSYAVLGISTRLAIYVCVICSCFFGFAIRAMCKMIKRKRVVRATVL